MSIDKISSLVKNQFPDFYKEEGPKFLAFVEAYYEYLEESGKMTDAVRNLKSYSDVNTTLDEYLEYFINTFLPSVPFEVFADKRLMVKYIKEFNRSRGTLASYRLLFRALYNEEIDVEYPADQILKVSDGDWRLDRYLIATFDPDTYQFIGKTIKGQESKAEALVEDIVRKNVRGRDLMQIILSNIKGKFGHNEPIRLLSDTGTGHSPLVEAGIANVEIVTSGGKYLVGDEVKLISNDQGEFAKAVVTNITDYKGVLTFNLNDGGSGYTASTDTDGSVISFTGGDGVEEGSFVINNADIVDRFAISMNIDVIGANTFYGTNGPTITCADGVARKMQTFANVLISSADYGFREASESGAGQDFRDNVDAVINIANTIEISVGDDLVGSTSGANAVVTAVNTLTDGDTFLKVDTFKRFTATETVTIGGSSVGTVTSFSANAIGVHPLQIANLASETISEGDELVGMISGAFGVVKHIGVETEDGYTPSTGPDRSLLTVRVSANNSSNITTQFQTGPLKSFLEDEGVRRVGSATSIANVVSTSSNTNIEGLYTKLRDAFQFESSTFGTIQNLSLPVGGSGFSVAPKISVTEPDIVILGIGEQYLTLQSDDNEWGSGNSQITTFDTNDRVVQASTGASGDIKGGKGSSTPSVIQHPNGTYETTVRVWQDFLQRDPGNKTFANNTTITINVFGSSRVPGTPDNRTIDDTATAKVVKVEDKGILGKNADIDATVGANGAITSIRVIDSGFSYKNGEVVIVETPNRDNAVSAELKLTIEDVANSEGYYASTRGHLDSLRGFVQDSRFYQEFSYQIVSPVSLDRYKEYALNLVHPAGQALFGKFRSQSNVNIDVVATSNNSVQIKDGTIALTDGSFDIVGTDTEFETNFANGGLIIVEHDYKQFYSIPINKITSDTTANLTIAWANSSISSANVYYRSGSN